MAKFQDQDDEERTKLLEEVETLIGRQRVVLFTTLLLQFFTLCADTIIIPFFPKAAKDRNLTNMHIGIVFSSFDLARCVGSPIVGSLVSMQYYLGLAISCAALDATYSKFSSLAIARLGILIG